MTRRCDAFSTVFWSSYTGNSPPSCAWPFSPDSGPHLHSWCPDPSLFLPTAFTQEYLQGEIKKNPTTLESPQNTYAVACTLLLGERDRGEVAIKRDDSSSKSLYLSAVKLLETRCETEGKKNPLRYFEFSWFFFPMLWLFHSLFFFPIFFFSPTS